MVGLALLDEDPCPPDESADGSLDQPARFEVLADSAYGTGEARDGLVEAGHTAINKPAPLRPAGAGG